MQRHWSIMRLTLGVVASSFASQVNATRGCPPMGTHYAESINRADFRVAAVQFPIEYGKTTEQFIAKMATMVRTARQDNARLVVFPELAALDMLSTSSGVSTAAQMRSIAEHSFTTIHDAIVQQAVESNMAILGGTLPRIAEDGRVVNTAVLAFPDGRVILQDKLFPTPEEREWGWRGGNELKVFEAPWGKTAILICYDSEIPMLSNMLAASMPEVILIPSMTGNDGFRRVHTSASTRAVEHHAFVVMTGTVDARPERREYCGQANFLSPCERGFPGILRQGTANASQVISWTFNLRQLAESRARDIVYPGRDQVTRTQPVRLITE